MTCGNASIWRQPRKFLPWFGVTHPYEICPGRDQGSHHGLADRGLAVGHQHFAEFRVAGHFTELQIVRHIGHLIDGKGQQYPLAGLVETRADAHSAGSRCASGMQMRDHGGSRIETHHPQAPRHSLAEEQVVAVMYGRRGNQFTGTGLFAPLKLIGQAAMAGLARGILDGAATSAYLQLEAAESSGRGESKRRARPCPRGQQRQSRAQNRILAFGSAQRLDHASARARMAAPEHRPRS